MDNIYVPSYSKKVGIFLCHEDGENMYDGERDKQTGRVIGHFHLPFYLLKY